MHCLGHATKQGGKNIRNPNQGDLKMNSYNPTSIRSNILAAFCTIVFSATCLVGALAPAQIASSSVSYTTVA
jgi:hypothetical protein